MENWYSLMPHLLKLIKVMTNRLSFCLEYTFNYLQNDLEHLQSDESLMQ